MNRKKDKYDLFYLILFIVGIGVFLVIWLGNEAVIEKATEEDGIVENLSAIFYLAGFAVCLYRIFRKTSGSKIWIYLWCFLCFIFFCEEISWFQRIFDYSTFPFMEKWNVQGEVNIHNLNIFQGGHWIEAISSNKYGLKMFLSSQNIFRLCFLTYFFVIPIIIYSGKLIILKNKLGYQVPEPRFVLTVWSVLVISFVFAVFSSQSIKSSIAETREMFYSLFILIYIYTHLRSVKSDQEEKIK